MTQKDKPLKSKTNNKQHNFIFCITINKTPFKIIKTF